MTHQMTDQQHVESAPHASGVEGGGPTNADLLAADPARRAAAQLELLSEEAREAVLAKMDPSIAERIRNQLTASTRPHGGFSTAVEQRREMIREMAERVSARRIAEVEASTARPPTSAPHAIDPHADAGAPGPPGQPSRPAAPTDPLDQLRELHPAAIARAMQGERAEAWAIVLDRLDETQRAALQLYLDPSARTAIAEARSRQAELAATSPALIATVEAAIARTVVPRAMREHHGLLSTTPLAWSSGGA